MYIGNAAIFFCGVLLVALGGWLIHTWEAAAVGTATLLFAIGLLLVFCASAGLVGVMRKSWMVRASPSAAAVRRRKLSPVRRAQILMGLVVTLMVLILALLAFMTVCFALGYQMPSLRDIVAEGWHAGCDDPATATEGCMQADLVATGWCWDHAGASVPGMFESGEKDALCSSGGLNLQTTPAAQKVHMCSVSCQKAFVATLESSMAYIAVGSYLAFFVLIIVTFWNSQTHHGCWCIKPSQDEDDDENTTMSIPLGMVYIAYVLNGTMALIGLFEAAIAAAMLQGSFVSLVAILLGVGYFGVACVACFAVSKNLHMVLRICNICYFCSCLPLLAMSLVASIYSGMIANIYDFYDDNWCTIRGQLDALTCTTDAGCYCEENGAPLSDAVCKANIVSDTADNIALIGYVIVITLAVIGTLIWFSTRLSRKFKFDGRNFDFGDDDFENPLASDEDEEDNDDKGGDEEDVTDSDADGGGGGGGGGGICTCCGCSPLQILIAAAPVLVAGDSCHRR